MTVYFPDSTYLQPSPPAWTHRPHRDKPLWFGPRFDTHVPVPHLVPPQKSLMSKNRQDSRFISSERRRQRTGDLGGPGDVVVINPTRRQAPWNIPPQYAAPQSYAPPLFPAEGIGDVYVHDFPYATPKKQRASTTGNVGWMGSGRDPQGEKKFHDFEFTSNNISASGQIIPSLNLVAQGTTEVTRIGRSINVTAIQLRYQLQIEATLLNVETSDTVRVMLIQDRQANAAAPSILNVIETADVLAFNNLANRGRFVTLFDRFHDCNISSGAGTEKFGNNIQTFDYYAAVDIPVQFDAAAGVIGEILSNNIFMLLISTSAHVDGFFSTRIRFSD